jgi:glycerol-3-phosphate dehydrogenase
MRRDLRQFSKRVYDVVIIGGGIYGVFTAWDAALRGLSVALVEQGDFGHATSSNTLRIIHGGLRYLQHGDIRRMRQSIRERRIFMQIAPHLIHPLPFLIPTYGHLKRGRGALSLALLIGDLIAFDHNDLDDPQKHLPRGQIISREGCLRLFPGVEANGLTGGAICYDGQMSNSERLILSVARSAATAEAVLANYVQATGLLRVRGRVAGLTARDVLTGDALDIRTRIVVNASGPWLDRVLGLLNGHQARPKLMLSKAFNLLVDCQRTPPWAVGIYGKGSFNDRNAILSKGGRLFFITPWHNRSLIGTAHLPCAADPDSVRVTEREIQDFLDEINVAYPVADLKRQDVCFVYSGLLPMAGDADQAGDVQLLKHYRILDHGRDEGLEGLISVAGVKFTEARYVAEKAVDLVFRKLGRRPPKARTAVTPVYGGQIPRFNDFLAHEVVRRPSGLSEGAIRHLISQYGSAYPEVLQYLEADPASSATLPATSCLEQGPSPWSRLGEERPLMPSLSWREEWGNEASWPTEATLTYSGPLAKAEVLYGIREEMAQKLADVVFRRTALGMIGNPGDAWVQTCATVMAQECGWDKARTQREIEDVNVTLSTRM